MRSDELLYCDKCGREIVDYWEEVGYDGPTDEKSTDCNPFVPWKTFCKKCHDKKHGRKD